MPVTTRTAKASDDDFLSEMLVEAASWRPGAPKLAVAQVLADPRLRRYVRGWPRDGDLGVIAEDGFPIGSAWRRLFSDAEPGYGYIGEDVPELAIGVVEHRRNEGIGRLLLLALLEECRADQYRVVSLSVGLGNRAARLYQQLGFRPMGRVSDSWTMVVDLGHGPPPGLALSQKARSTLGSSGD